MFITYNKLIINNKFLEIYEILMSILYKFFRQLLHNTFHNVYLEELSIINCDKNIPSESLHSNYH